MRMRKEVFILSIDDILPNRFQPRIKFDEKAILELSDSIKKHGVIQPIIVRKIADKYEIIAGERRYKASVLAGRTTIPAIITDVDDKESAEIALIENVQRQDMTPIEEAISYKKILDMGYINQTDLATKLGKTQSTIANKLRLLNLVDEVQEALLDEKISERHARSLLKVEKTKQKEILDKIIKERLTVRKTDQLINDLKNSEEKEEKEEENMNNNYNDINNNFNIPTNPIMGNDNLQQSSQMDINYNVDNGIYNTPQQPFNPFGMPTEQPSEPMSNPFGMSTTQPSDQMSNPFGMPTTQPSEPMSNPFEMSTVQPNEPMSNPFGMPTEQPSEPMSNPFEMPTTQPSDQMSNPFEMSTVQPNEPMSNPFGMPTEQPSEPMSNPFGMPTTQPSDQMSNPFGMPTAQPGEPMSNSFEMPTSQPDEPMSNPFEMPTSQPGEPMSNPFEMPTAQPGEPMSNPFEMPTSQPGEPMSNPFGMPEMNNSAFTSMPNYPLPEEKELTPLMPNQLEMENRVDIRTVINNVRDCIKNIEALGFKVDSDELDFENSYEITIKIDKN